MILTCASCLTRYYADDASIGPSGRSVRCASCGHTWYAEPALTLEESADSRPPPLTRERVERMRKAAAVDSTGPAPSAAARFRAQQAERMRRERIRAAAFAWAGAGAALAASAAGAVVFRQDVAELWPRSASAFAAVGFDVNVYGLELDDLAVERAFEGPTPVLLISGEVRNLGRDLKRTPPLRITLRDAESNELYQVVHQIEARAVAPGQGVPFEVRLENPPIDAVDLEAAFATYAEASLDSALTAPPAAPLVDADGTPLELSVDSIVPAQSNASAGVGGPEIMFDDAPALRLEMSDDMQGNG